MMSANTIPHGAIIQTSGIAGGGAGSPSPPKIPFESSKTMDEGRIQVLRKFKKDIVETVKFSDVSETLIACGFVSKEECYEICKLPVSKQMMQCYQKLHDIMDILVYQKTVSQQQSQSKNDDPSSVNNNGANSQSSSAMEEKQKGMVKELWNNFVTSLQKEHLGLALKMENELDKVTEHKLLLKPKRGNNNSPNNNSSFNKLKKEDIGLPTNFKHIQHFKLITRSQSEPIVRLRKDKEKEREIKNDKGGKKINEEIEQMRAPETINLDENDPDLQEFFDRAGVAQRHLIDLVTRQIIIKFIIENGGMAAIRQEVKSEVVSQRSDQELTPMDPSPGMKACHDVNDKETSSPQPQPLPANVPFEPTPRPTSLNLFYC